LTMRALVPEKVTLISSGFLRDVFPLWVFASWTTVVALGYIGVAVFIITIVRTLLPGFHQKQKYVSAAEKETLIKTKEVLRYSGALPIVMGALVFAGFLYLEGNLPGSYVHFFVLAAAYMILYYTDLSIREKISRSPLPLGMPKNREEIRFLTKTFKKILDVNAVALLIFFIFHIQMKSAPFHRIWAIIAWAGTLVYMYPLALLVDSFAFIFTRDTHLWFDFRNPRVKRIAWGIIILASWFLAFWWLELG